MFIAIKCKNCGIWQGKQPKEIRKYTFKCSICNKGGKVWIDRSLHPQYLYHTKDSGEEVKLAVQYLNAKRKRKE